MPRGPSGASGRERVEQDSTRAGVMRGVTILLLALLAAPLRPASADPDRIELRGGAPALAGRISGVGDGGITIVDASGTSRALSWDRVRGVDSPQWQRDVDRRMSMATDLWRARIRIERGDTELAEPLLEAHADLMRSSRSETGLIVAEGLLRCRLSRGEHALAIEPAIRTASLRRSGVTTGAFAGLPPVIDAPTGLCPQLPPIVIQGPAVATMRSSLEAIVAGSDPIAAEVAALYRESLVVAGDGEILPVHDLPRPLPGAPGDPGATLLRALLAAMAPRASDAAADAASAARGDARRRLIESSSQVPALSRPWAAAWAAFFIGASSLKEQDAAQRLRGIVALLTIPAEAGRRRPWLAGVALVAAARALAAEGDAAGAARLRREFETEHSYHPLGSGRSPRQTSRTSPAGSLRSSTPATPLSLCRGRHPGSPEHSA